MQSQSLGDWWVGQCEQTRAPRRVRFARWSAAATIRREVAPTQRHRACAWSHEARRHTRADAINPLLGPDEGKREGIGSTLASTHLLLLVD